MSGYVDRIYALINERCGEVTYADQYGSICGYIRSMGYDVVITDLFGSIIGYMRSLSGDTIITDQFGSICGYIRTSGLVKC